MTLEELHTILNAVYPTAFWSWPVGQAPELPYLVYFQDGTDNFGADNVVYYSAKTVFVELLTKTRDLTAEANVEAALAANDIYWTKTLTHLDDEDAFEVIYTMEV